jgi:serine/threonine protein kinase
MAGEPKRPFLGKLKTEVVDDDPEEVFEMVDIIGEGAYGLICTCKNIKQNRIYAIKFLEIEEEDEHNLLNELSILKEAEDCPYTVKYFGCYVKDSTLMFVMEFCDGGSALDVLNATTKTLEEDHIAAVCACIVQGLIYLHSHKILHRDLKAGNILLTSDGIAKLADFGVSARLKHTLEKKDTVVGSPYWMAPEVISVQKEKAEGYDFKADIWSTAITAIELAEGKPPLFEIASLRVIFLIPARDPPKLQNPDKFSPEFNDFLRVCLQKSPADRPTAKQLLEHPFVQRGLKSQSLLKKLVSETLPALQHMRDLKKKEEQKKNQEDDGSGSDDEGRSSGFTPGTTITINRQTGSVTMTSGSGSYGTTVISSEDLGTFQERRNSIGE